MTSRIACCRRVSPVTGSGSSVTLGRPGPAPLVVSGSCRRLVGQEASARDTGRGPSLVVLFGRVRFGPDARNYPDPAGNSNICSNDTPQSDGFCRTPLVDIRSDVLSNLRSKYPAFRGGPDVGRTRVRPDRSIPARARPDAPDSGPRPLASVTVLTPPREVSWRPRCGSPGAGCSRWPSRSPRSGLGLVWLARASAPDDAARAGRPALGHRPGGRHALVDRLPGRPRARPAGRGCRPCSSATRLASVAPGSRPGAARSVARRARHLLLAFQVTAL